MLGDMPHNRRAHAITADVVGVVITLGKHVAVVQSHEPHRAATAGATSLYSLRPPGLPDATTRPPVCEDSPLHRQNDLGALALRPVFVGAGAPIQVPTTLLPLLVVSDTFLRLNGDMRVGM